LDEKLKSKNEPAVDAAEVGALDRVEEVAAGGMGGIAATRRNTLHWAASSDDVGLVEILLELGADIDATGGVIAGGTPRRCCCRRPVERGLAARRTRREYATVARDPGARPHAGSSWMRRPT